MLFVDMSRCILSKFYIKPQRRRWLSCCFSVVSYRNSTSNHNNKRKEACQNHVVSYRNSTSNHNNYWSYWKVWLLYLIEILHQTTTIRTRARKYKWLYLIEILHQTTTNGTATINAAELYLIEILHQTTTYIRCGLISLSCILSKFYIKPQLVRNFYGYSQVVSYRNSTSNHNNEGRDAAGLLVVSYRNSTSNHNLFGTNVLYNTLYLIEILHQTTTRAPPTLILLLLYLIEILHQTTTLKANQVP